MSMSIMITSDDCQNIKKTIDCLSLLSKISQNTTEIDFNNTQITSDSINSLISYYKKIYNVLTTSGMTLEQYQDSIEYTDIV